MARPLVLCYGIVHVCEAVREPGQPIQLAMIGTRLAGKAPLLPLVLPVRDCTYVCCNARAWAAAPSWP